MITNDPYLACFFYDHLKKDLKIIGKCLSQGENEVVMVLHRIIHQLTGLQPTIGKYAKQVYRVVTLMCNPILEYICST